MTDIIAFISARLGETQADAEAAQAADPAPWIANASDDASTPERYGHGAGLVIAADEVALWDCEGSDTLCMTAATARHVARHDPAHVLAEVKAKRAILAEHAQVRSDVPGPYGYTVYGCTVCDAGCQCYPEVNKFGTEGCTTVRLMAAVYAEHPDYNPAWRVE